MANGRNYTLYLQAIIVYTTLSTLYYYFVLQIQEMIWGKFEWNFHYISLVGAEQLPVCCNSGNSVKTLIL